MNELIKFLKKSPKSQRILVLKIIEQIKNGDLKNLKIIKIKNSHNLYRVKKGRIRIIIEKIKENFIVKKVTLRDENTYRNI